MSSPPRSIDNTCQQARSIFADAPRQQGSDLIICEESAFRDPEAPHQGGTYINLASSYADMPDLEPVDPEVDRKVALSSLDRRIIAMTVKEEDPVKEAAYLEQVKRNHDIIMKFWQPTIKEHVKQNHAIIMKLWQPTFNNRMKEHVLPPRSPKEQVVPPRKVGE